VSAPGWARNTSADLAPATGARTTRFCRTLWRRSSGVMTIAHGKPALRSIFTHDAAASTASRPNVRDDGQRPLCPQNLPECANGRFSQNRPSLELSP
jgi:hypothetical protein